MLIIKHKLKKIRFFSPVLTFLVLCLMFLSQVDEKFNILLLQVGKVPMITN